MVDIASKRRDNVALFKKIFLFAKLTMMLVLSVAGSIYFVWSQFYNNELRNSSIPDFSTENFLKYCNDPANLIFIIASVICAFAACGFIAFLVLHGIEKLVVKFMMRKANTGG